MKAYAVQKTFKTVVVLQISNFKLQASSPNISSACRTQEFVFRVDG